MRSPRRRAGRPWLKLSSSTKKACGTAKRGRARFGEADAREASGHVLPDSSDNPTIEAELGDALTEAGYVEAVVENQFEDAADVVMTSVSAEDIAPTTTEAPEIPLPPPELSILPRRRRQGSPSEGLGRFGFSVKKAKTNL